jgi:hypothetical protein
VYCPGYFAPLVCCRKYRAEHSLTEKNPAKVACRHGRYGRVARTDRAAGLGPTVHRRWCQPKVPTYADRHSKVPTGSSVPGPTVGRAVLVCPGMPRPAYVDPQTAVLGHSEGACYRKCLCGLGTDLSSESRRGKNYLEDRAVQRIFGRIERSAFNFRRID